MSLALPVHGSEEPYRVVRQRIIEGVYGAGERLIEERLAQELGVSRTPIRQALSALAAEGLIQLVPNRGAVVRTFSLQELRETFDLRALLEGYAAFHAALHIDAEQLATLRAMTQEMEVAIERKSDDRRAEVRSLVDRNRVFHDTIVRASGNHTLPQLLRQVTDVPLMFRSFYWYSPEERRRSVFLHWRIVDALAARDPERARMLMQEHVYEGRDFLLQSLAERHDLDVPLRPVAKESV